MTISVEIKKAITADAVVNVLAGADAPLSSSAVAKALRTSQTKKVVGVLTTLVREEMLERVGRQYRLRDHGRYDAPLATSQGTRRTLLPTNKQEIAAGERRKAVAKRAKQAVAIPESSIPVGVIIENVPPAITKLEEIEAKVDENKARDQRIRDAIAGLKRKSKRAEMEIAPVDNYHFKIEVLDGIGGTDADLVVIMREIVVDLRRLNALTEQYR